MPPVWLPPKSSGLVARHRKNICVVLPYVNQGNQHLTEKHAPNHFDPHKKSHSNQSPKHLTQLGKIGLIFDRCLRGE